MQTDRGSHEPRLEDRLRLIVVDSPEVAAPLVSALDVAEVGAWMWVDAERALYFTPRVLELLGLPLEPRENLLARYLGGVYSDDQHAVATLLRCELPAGPLECRYRFTPPEGPLRWIEHRGRVERTRTGQLIRQGGTIRDVTNEVGRELERREAHARLEALVNAMPFAVWGRSGSGLPVTHQNAESVAAWGDIRGTRLDDAPLEVRAIWQAQLADVMTGQVVRAKQEQVRQGERHILQEIIAPVVVEDEVTGAVGVAIDVTDEERARIRLQEAHKLESLGVLAGGIAHDFNNLLTAILGNASLLRVEHGQSMLVSTQLDHIEAAARRAAELCRQMLTYAGRGRFALRPVNLNDIIASIQALMAVTLPQQAALDFALAPELPRVLADDTQIRELLMNLVMNASEALRNRPGTITISTSSGHRRARELAHTVFSPQLGDGEYVSLRVRDTGEGMTDDTIPGSSTPSSARDSREEASDSPRRWGLFEHTTERLPSTASPVRVRHSSCYCRCTLATASWHRRESLKTRRRNGRRLGSEERSSSSTMNSAYGRSHAASWNAPAWRSSLRKTAPAALRSSALAPMKCAWSWWI
jgi:signal transduction histidine kinase